ncbi:MAG: TonB-dependent receptor [Bacteroidetes bacterium]|nr:TonB-dependent receptor [Bacteroidota bacterium]
MLRWLSTAAIVLGFCQILWAQVVTTSAISGRVLDQRGEALPGANVVAVHLPSGTQYGTATRADGRYNLTGLRPGGPYTVRVSFVGYRTEERSGIELVVGQDLELNFRLVEAAVQAGEVVVTGERLGVINPDRTGAQTFFSREQLERLPTINRALSDFTRLTPQTTGFNSFAGRNNLYNNISIDGSVLNNVFGLASEVGGQTRAQVISPEAIEQITVDIAPYDVRQGSFTGAGINVVTRSGTNEFKASAYSYVKNEDFVSERVADAQVAPVRFSERQTGVAIGGPIVRGRLFFFANGEIRRRVDPGATFRPRTSPTETGPDVAAVDRAVLEQLRNALLQKFNYDPGSWDPYDLNSASENLTLKLDWNLGLTHRATLRLNYLNSFRDIPISNSGSIGGRQNGPNTVPFSRVNYNINNDAYSAILQLNSTFGNRYANQFTVGFTALRDFRKAFSDPFPLVDILSNPSTTMTSFGYEPFTANNRLNTNIWQLANNFSAFLGRHTITVGTSNEIYATDNWFTPWWYGYYVFRSAQDFLEHINAPNPTASNVPQPRVFRLQYSLLPGGEVPIAKIRAWQFGAYAQDEWRVLNNLRLTLGLRVDMPIFLNKLQTNERVAQLTFARGLKIDTGRLPKATPLWSPRLGFNWDVWANRRLQLRGGTGIFTGKIPFVWVSNQASNNGLLLGETFVSAPSAQINNRFFVLRNPGDNRQIVFSPDRRTYIPANPQAPPTVLINVTAENFKFPQVWRTNLALDVRLPGDVIATLEGIYTEDINAVFHWDANFRDPIGTFNGPDRRPRFAGSAAANRINSSVTNAIVLDNTSQGYQYFLTAQLEKLFTGGPLRGLYGRFSYTHGKARDLTSSTSAIAATAWFNNQIYTNPNEPVLGYSVYDQRHRLVGLVNYRLEAFGLSGTTLSVVWVGGSGSNFSYVYGGDMNGDGIAGNDLIYVPRDASEIRLVPSTGQADAAQAWRELNAFIEQDSYLKTRRGKYAERGGATTPWVNRVDVSIKQAFYVPIAGRRTSVEVSLDLINFGNLLNSNWGVVYRPITTSPIQFVRVDPDGVPVFSFPYRDGKPLTQSFTPDVDLSSRWQAQLGLRIAF